MASHSDGTNLQFFLLLLPRTACSSAWTPHSHWSLFVVESPQKFPIGNQKSSLHWVRFFFVLFLFLLNHISWKKKWTSFAWIDSQALQIPVFSCKLWSATRDCCENRCKYCSSHTNVEKIKKNWLINCEFYLPNLELAVSGVKEQDFVNNQSEIFPSENSFPTFERLRKKTRTKKKFTTLEDLSSKQHFRKNEDITPF